ncbi:hypothetical protein AKO1_004847 [Acrasis kona]|uniref:Uncharacterized protein n=1 Tax=Acrasis kona TaxID=1008807 RepID=A0AAW2Z4G8_9EUKA
MNTPMTSLAIESPANSFEQNIEIYSPNCSIMEDVFHRSSDSPSAEQLKSENYAISTSLKEEAVSS